MGSGRLLELKEYLEAVEADLIIFDEELSPAQLRNIEELCDCPVLDRTMLILDIFAARAASGEGKLQVELARAAIPAAPLGGPRGAAFPAGRRRDRRDRWPAEGPVNPSWRWIAATSAAE